MTQPCLSTHVRLLFKGFLLFHTSLLLAQTTPPVTATRQQDGVLIQTAHDQMQVTICDASIIHIRSAPAPLKLPVASDSPWITHPCAPASFSFTQTKSEADIETSQLKVEVSLTDGKISFKDKADRTLLSEHGANSRSYTPVDTQPSLYRIVERFQLSSQSALYGLGQHSAGLFNYNGSSITLSQFNGDIGIPLVVSNAGYGLLWNSAARTVFNDQIPGGFEITQSAGKAIDFYFLYGPEMDQIIHLYRMLTGHAPMLGEWAYGFIQSKNRYHTQQELVDAVDEYRKRHIPLDAIVQDYYWWTAKGSSTFNSSYPNIQEAVQHIHDQHTHVMISIWPNLDRGTELSEQMTTHHLLIPGSDVYDATSPAARDLYWQGLPATLLAKGFDALWLDASEPEIAEGKQGIPSDVKVAIGPGALYANAFAFFHTGGVSQQWRKTEDTKRVFLLTRSAFLGQQSNATAIWSGDIGSDFDTLSRQIPAGLNMMLSGIPYWTTDIGGYSFPDGDPNNPAYRELFTRWFEYGAFCPLFRVHGRRVNNANELWSYGDASPILLKFDKLRYRLLPYLYSLAFRVTNDDYTIMRPLMMDWRTDPKASSIGNSFMFGPAFLVNPITQAGATSRSVYLPAATAWYDFWTGEKVTGAQTIQAEAPIDKIPLYVRAGSIVPLGPEVEYAGEKPNAPIELRVYPGADGAFSLYSDQGDTYAYEHGAYTSIPISWNEASATLTIGERTGRFPGMPEQQTFHIVWVGPQHGAGPAPVTDVDKTVLYAGHLIQVKRF